MKVWRGNEVEGANTGVCTLFVEERELTKETIERLEEFVDRDCVLYFGAAEKSFMLISEDFLNALKELILAKRQTGISVKCTFEMSLQDCIMYSSRVSSYKIITRIDENILRDSRPLKVRHGNDIYVFDGKSVSVNCISDEELACMRYKDDVMLLED